MTYLVSDRYTVDCDNFADNNLHIIVMKYYIKI